MKGTHSVMVPKGHKTQKIEARDRISVIFLNSAQLSWVVTPSSVVVLKNAVNPSCFATTHKKKLALKSFLLVIKRTHSVKIASLCL